MKRKIRSPYLHAKPSVPIEVIRAAIRKVHWENWVKEHGWSDPVV